MAKKLQLQVPTPCHENWENMTPTERGRFCASCQKQVVDFSNKSDREIAMFFKKPSTGSVCGRFMEDQLNRDIEIPKKRIPWLKYFFQIAIPTFLASCDHRTQGKVEVRALSVAPLETKEEFSKQVCTTTMGMPDIVFNGDTLPSSAVGKNLRMRTCTIIEQIDTIDEPPCIMGDVEPISPQEFVAADSLQPIKGKVVDGDGKPIASAGIMVRGTKNGTTTDDNGFFSIYPKSESNDMTLVIAAVGFNTAEMQIKYEGNNFLGNIILVPIRLQFSGEVMVTKVTGDTVTAIRKKNPIKLLQQIFRDTAFNINLEIIFSSYSTNWVNWSFQKK